MDPKEIRKKKLTEHSINSVIQRAKARNYVSQLGKKDNVNKTRDRQVAVDAPKNEPKREVFEQEYWRKRIVHAISIGKIRDAICIISDSDWSKIQYNTSKALKELLNPDESVIDIGCGIGSLLECYPFDPQKYLGTDFCDYLISICKIYHPQYKFQVADARDLRQFQDQQFDWVIARGVTGMIKDNIGLIDCKLVVTEMKRIGKRVISMGCNPSTDLEYL